MDYNKRIRSSSLIFTLKKTSELVFSQWLKCAKDFYNLPTEFVESIKSDDVEPVFIEHLEKAINALVENKSDEKVQIKGWSYGYLCGYLEGCINVTWTNKYIIEPSKEYEDMIKIKSIIEYINWNESSSKHMLSIYNYLINKRIKPLELKGNIPDNVVTISSHTKSDKNKENEFKISIIDLLSDELKSRILSSLEEKQCDCCPSLDEYLDYSDVKKIVGNEHFI